MSSGVFMCECQKSVEARSVCVCMAAMVWSMVQIFATTDRLLITTLAGLMPSTQATGGSLLQKYLSLRSRIYFAIAQVAAALLQL